MQSTTNELITPAFNNRNYFVHEKLIEPSLSYMQGTKFRATLLYDYSIKKNSEGFSEKATSNVFKADVKYSVLSNSIIGAKFSVNNIDFVYLAGGSPSSTVGYIMLDGLLPGKNYVWNVDISKRLSGNLELSLQYDGRKPASSHIVHTGNISVRAIL